MNLRWSSGWPKQQKKSKGPNTVYVLPPETKLRSLSGADGCQVDSFIEDVRTAMKLRKLTRVSAADFIIAHLDGPARREIRHRPSKLSSDPDKILDVLRDMFGERYTLGSLMRQVCNCTQGDRESTSDFDFRQMALAEKLSMIDDAPNPERTIREQFCDGLRDKTLRRELKRLLKDEVDMSYIQLRDWALDMGEDESPGHGKRMAAVSLEKTIGDKLSGNSFHST
ncbi:hypothetical protein BSL78_01410 [Apostichopus japonicus]|uniref:Uncharacterized protein n=1 Tax=Stichopus japonicus TaxID=307972 RepID=A0A2G8LN12_STIJA|nr:hypothetical protein BSL78_01410 [Apostichopus japonicus]